MINAKKVVLTRFFLTSIAACALSMAFSIDAFAEKRAPEFSLKDLNGRQVALSSFRGKVVLLAFWATWCPSCKDEMPKFNRLYRELKSRGLEIIAISSDYSIDSLKEYLAKNPFDFHILYDGKRQATAQYRVSFLPVTFLIDRNGAIADRIPGEFEWPSAEMEKKIERLLRN